MPRPLIGTCKRREDGTWVASLPVERGAKRRRSATFPDEAAARAWLDAGRHALAVGHPLPDPNLFRGDGPRYRRPTWNAVDAPTIAYVAHAWHETLYDANFRAGPERAAQVRDEIDHKLLAFCNAAGLQRIDDLTHEAVVDFARWLGGWKTLYLDIPARHQIPGHAKTTSSRTIGTVRSIVRFAVARGWLDTDVTSHVRVMPKYGDPGKRAKERPITLPEARRLAARLHVVHQLALWMQYLLQLRQGECFGVRVCAVIDLGRHGLMAIEEQGGRSFVVRDSVGEEHEVAHKQGVKNDQSHRVLVVPESLMVLIRIVIDAFHTDPETGEVDQAARLIPGVQRPGVAGQHTFGRRLRQVGADIGLEQAKLARLTPHHLRRAGSSLLAQDSSLNQLLLRRFMGHHASDDVFGRHYFLDVPESRENLRIAEAIDNDVTTAIGGLIVPTTVRPQWGRAHPMRTRLDHVAAVLAVHGWEVDEPDDDGDPWCDPTRVAVELGIGVTTARRKMREGEIPAQQRKWGTRDVWCSKLSQVHAYARNREAGTLVDDLAEELGQSYHEVYRTLRRLDIEPHRRGQRHLVLTDQHVDAVRAEVARIAALHERAMPIREAARLLGRRDRTLRDRVKAGKVEVDPEVDSTGARFLSRESVERLLADRARVPETEAETMPLGAVADLADLTVPAVRRLVAKGLLETRKVGRSAEVTRNSFERWVAGYRPDLL